MAARRAFYRGAAGKKKRAAKPRASEACRRASYLTSCAKIRISPMTDITQDKVRSQMIPAT